MSSTGKGGQYRYYVCAENTMKGASACPGFRINAGQVEGAVMSAIQEDLLTSSRVHQILDRFTEHQAERDTQQAQRVAVLQQRLDNVQKEIDSRPAAGQSRYPSEDRQFCCKH